MSIFASLSKALAPPPAPSKSSEGFDIPFGLSEGDFRKLKELRTSDAWKILQRVVDTEVNFVGEKMLQSSKDDVLHFHRGSVWGLRRIFVLLEQAVQKEAHFEQSQNRIPDERKRPRSSLFGTPSWRAHATRD